MWGTDKELHKFPKGFKQKLAKHYGFNTPMCVLCWSKNKVAIHHHFDVINREIPIEERNAYYYQVKNNIDWSDLSKFVLLCGSCHSKIHSAIIFGGFIDNKRPPILYLLNKIIKEAKESNGT